MRPVAALAPMPEDPSRCRWCGARRKAVIAGVRMDYCDNGCAPNDQAPYRDDCAECHRPFQTGKRGAVTCHWCESREIGRIVASYQVYDQALIRG